MTTEEKLQHFYEVSIESAKEEASKAISEYKASLEENLEKHKKEKQAASENQFKIESENAAREINKALSSEHLHIKRRLSKKQQELQEKLFDEVEEMLQTFLATPQYEDWLEEKIKKALEAAGEDQAEIYLSSGDQTLAEEMEKRTGIRPLISQTSFIGGIRAVIPDKNILIDYTLLTMLENEKENFNFDGGLNHE
ncbi:MAG TPA: V-type ATP synthase subunit E [Candidatus Blautia stercoripullorum]|uniref:V-type ATP synthase subunit E n=1 Tax=Candidatus Blautia stercoripullorum TaxID=2838502 RepID=A0A9D2R9Q6_9FIRM|nr:V-type ATP synthase subunit E [Candidatus Blautia stercoripullorum]